MEIVQQDTRPLVNLLFVHSEAGMYGSDQVLLHISTGMDKSKYRPLVILPHQGPLAEKLREAQIPVKVIKMGVLRRKYMNPKGIISYLWLLITAVYRLKRIIEKEHIHIVYSNTCAVLAGALAARWQKIPHVWHIHEVIVSPGWLRMILSWILYHFSDSIVAISQAVKSHLISGFKPNEEKIVLIHNGIDVSEFDPKNRSDKIRKEFHIPKDAIVIGMIGRINRWKGQEHFIEVASKIHDQFSQVKFLIVGDPYRGEEHRVEKIQDMITNLRLEDHIILTGFRSEITEVLSSLDIFVLPSQWPEPFGLVVLEAMGMEKPVVATNHGGPKDIVIDGKTGYLVSPSDVSEMVRVLSHLIRNDEDRLKMGKSGRIRVQDSFTLEQQINSINALCRTVLKEKELKP